MHASYGTTNRSETNTTMKKSSSSSSTTSSSTSKGIKRRHGFPGRGSSDVKLRKESDKLKARFEQSWKGGGGRGSARQTADSRISSHVAAMEGDTFSSDPLALIKGKRCTTIPSTSSSKGKANACPQTMNTSSVEQKDQNHHPSDAAATSSSSAPASSSSVIAECIRRFRTEPAMSREERARLRVEGRGASSSPIYEEDFWWRHGKSVAGGGRGGGRSEVRKSSSDQAIGCSMGDDDDDDQMEQEDGELYPDGQGHAHDDDGQESSSSHESSQEEEERGDGALEGLSEELEEEEEEEEEDDGRLAAMDQEELEVEEEAEEMDSEVNELDARANVLLQKCKSVLEDFYLPDVISSSRHHSGRTDQGAAYDDDEEGDDDDGVGTSSSNAIAEEEEISGASAADYLTFGDRLRSQAGLVDDGIDVEEEETDPTTRYVDQLLQEALRLSLAKPEDAVERLRVKLGLVDAASLSANNKGGEEEEGEGGGGGESGLPIPPPPTPTSSSIGPEEQQELAKRKQKEEEGAAAAVSEQAEEDEIFRILRSTNTSTSPFPSGMTDVPQQREQGDARVDHSLTGSTTSIDSSSSHTSPATPALDPCVTSFYDSLASQDQAQQQPQHPSSPTPSHLLGSTVEGVGGLDMALESMNRASPPSPQTTESTIDGGSPKEFTTLEAPGEKQEEEEEAASFVDPTTISGLQQQQISGDPAVSSDDHDHQPPPPSSGKGPLHINMECIENKDTLPDVMMPEYYRMQFSPFQQQQQRQQQQQQQQHIVQAQPQPSQQHQQQHYRMVSEIQHKASFNGGGGGAAAAGTVSLPLHYYRRVPNSPRSLKYGAAALSVAKSLVSKVVHRGLFSAATGLDLSPFLGNDSGAHGRTNTAFSPTHAREGTGQDKVGNFSAVGPMVDNVDVDAVLMNDDLYKEDPIVRALRARAKELMKKLGETPVLCSDSP